MKNENLKVKDNAVKNGKVVKAGKTIKETKEPINEKKNTVKNDSKNKVQVSLFSVTPKGGKKYYQLKSRTEKLRLLRSLCKGQNKVLGWYHLGLKQLLDECLRNGLISKDEVEIKSEVKSNAEQTK